MSDPTHPNRPPEEGLSADPNIRWPWQPKPPATTEPIPPPVVETPPLPPDPVPLPPEPEPEPIPPIDPGPDEPDPIAPPDPAGPVTEPVSPYAAGSGLYAKAICSAVVAGLTTYIAAADDGIVTNGEWITVIVTVIAALGVVWAIPQTPAWLARYGKALCAGLIAAGGVLVTGYLDDVLTTSEILTAIVAFLLGSGLAATVPNAAASDPVVDGKLTGVSEQAKEVLVKSRAHGLPAGKL